jgi:hypothetical protein
MKRVLLSILAGVGLVALLGAAAAKEDRSKTYDATGDVIEACSCPLFCSCYFNSEPANPHMCTFNNVYQFRKGSHYGDTDLSGARVWLSGDLGADALSKGEAGWVMVTFDKKSTPAQRTALGALMGKIYPVKWGKMETREDDIEWHHDAENKANHAKMGSGMAEVTLARGGWEASKSPTVIRGLKYFGANSNEGFLPLKATHYYHGDQKFDLKDMNGFFITLHSHGEIPAGGSQAGRP